MDIFTQIAQLKKEGKVVGFTASTFDLLHAGHVIMLQEAKTLCDYLIVGLLTDPRRDRPEKNYPIQTSWERWIQAQAIKAIDRVVPFDTEEDLENIKLNIAKHRNGPLANVNLRFRGDRIRFYGVEKRRKK